MPDPNPQDPNSEDSFTVNPSPQPPAENPAPANPLNTGGGTPSPQESPQEGTQDTEPTPPTEEPHEIQTKNKNFKDLASGEEFKTFIRDLTIQRGKMSNVLKFLSTYQQ